MVAAVSANRIQPNSLPTAGSAYTVQRGDCLWNIAKAHGISLEALIKANPQIANPDLIFPDQKINLPSGASVGNNNGGVTGPGGVDGPVGAGGGAGNPAEIAKKYLGRNASDLKTDTGDKLPMNANCPNNVCCANFVSAALIESGQLDKSKHTLGVAQLNSTLRADGWKPVSLSEAKPGDVVIIQGGGTSHTEIYAGNGKMIGSNNTNADGSQRVGMDDISWAMKKGAVILRAPDSVRAKSEAPSTNAVGAPAGSEAGRAKQAMDFFVSKGWSREQAAGIVANLSAESGIQHNRAQNGGGPGYGLAQWEGPRQGAFRAWAGVDIHQSTFQQQLAFIDHELRTSEAGAGTKLRQTTTAADAAAAFCRYYERPADTAGQSAYRASIANRYL